ncbi:MAG: histidine phosphatase family protein, partial [Verrucomicrobia bacterium]|nr:histidine phosphatase family protein [Verrucomicrobiota bacterium]
MKLAQRMYVREQPTRLHLVRHGEVDEAYHQVFGGSIDMELSLLGHEQAKSLAKFLNGRNFDRIYRSPMIRVRQTAKPLLDALEREAEVIDDLREVD